jgi:hypothetical protein
MQDYLILCSLAALGAGFFLGASLTTLTVGSYGFAIIAVVFALGFAAVWINYAIESIWGEP